MVWMVGLWDWNVQKNRLALAAFTRPEIVL